MITHVLDSVRLATGFEVVVVGCFWFLQCLFAIRETFGI